MRINRMSLHAATGLHACIQRVFKACTASLHATMKDSSMRVSSELLDTLHEMKQDRQETYEDVIWRVLEDYEGESPGPEPASVPQASVAHEEVAAEETDGGLTYTGERVDLDLPGSGALRDRREETIYRMVALLEREGTATKQDFLELVDPDAVGYVSAESFWANCIKGRDSLKAVPGVEKPPDGLTQWRWVDDGGHQPGA